MAKKGVMSKITKELNNIAIPLIIQSISGLFIGLTDQAMVGRISIFAFGAAGVIVSLLFMVAGVLGSISVIFNINAGKSIGKGDNEDFQDEFASSLIVNFCIGFLFFLIIIIFKKIILRTLFGFDGEILDEAIKYANIMSIYLLIQLLLFNFNSFFKIQKKTKWILIGSVISSLINLALDYILIFGKLGFPQLGVTGAALGSIIALLINLLIYVIVCWKNIKIRFGNFHIYKSKTFVYIKDSIPLMGQEILEGSVFVIAVNAIVARIGVIELSSYLILVQLVNILLMPMFMYGSAALTLVSQSVGVENEEELKAIPKVGMLISTSIYIVLGIVFIALRDLLPKIISNEMNVISYTSSILFLMIFAHLFNPIATVLRYSLQSIGLSKYVLFITAIINLLVLVIMLILVNLLNLRIYGIFISLCINYLLTATSYWIKYFIQNKRVIEKIPT